MVGQGEDIPHGDDEMENERTGRDKKKSDSGILLAEVQLSGRMGCSKQVGAVERADCGRGAKSGGNGGGSYRGYLHGLKAKASPEQAPSDARNLHLGPLIS